MACSYRLLAALDLLCLSVVRLHFYAAGRCADLAGGHASSEINVTKRQPRPPHLRAFSCTREEAVIRGRRVVGT